MRSSLVWHVLLVAVVASTSFAEDKLMMTVEEFLDVPEQIKAQIYKELADSSIWDRMEYQEGYTRLADDYLRSVGVDLDERKARLQDAEETRLKQIKYDLRNHLEPIKIDRNNIGDRDLASVISDPVWHMTFVYLESEEKRKRGRSRRMYYIHNQDVIVDSLIAFFVESIETPGFVPGKVYVEDGVPVINYRGGTGDRFVIDGRDIQEKSGFRLWINGVDINEKYGISDAIMPCFYNERLFFVFRKVEKRGEKWGWCYDGNMHEDVWDHVFHINKKQGNWANPMNNPTEETGFIVIKNDIRYTCRPVLRTIEE
ncbi:hypothetical protein ACFLQV_04390 [Calditrichota bacterium]